MGEGLIHMHAKFERASPKTLEVLDFFPKSWRRPPPDNRRTDAAKYPHRFSSADRRYSGAKKWISENWDFNKIGCTK